MTKEEAEKYIKSQMCSTCGVYLGGGKCSDNCIVIEAIKALEQEPKLEKDGTLIVTTEHYKNVGRVLVQHGTNGTLFYKDRI